MVLTSHLKSSLMSRSTSFCVANFTTQVKNMKRNILIPIQHITEIFGEF